MYVGKVMKIVKVNATIKLSLLSMIANPFANPQSTVQCRMMSHVNQDVCLTALVRVLFEVDSNVLVGVFFNSLNALQIVSNKIIVNRILTPQLGKGYPQHVE